MMSSYQKSDPQSIQEMFGTIAKNYDRTNAILSFSLHRHWNASLIRAATQNNPQGDFADLCCGTGEIAFGHLNKTKNPCHAYLIDFCGEMLQCAKEKATKLPYENHKLSFIQADVQAIPLPDKNVQFATMAYGIRNVKDPQLCIQEVYRILKPGGTFAILELTQPTNPALRLGHRLYLNTVLPVLGKWLTSNQEAYRYLCNSIQHFVQPTALEEMLKKAGFVNTRRIPLTGGTATIILGDK